MPIRATVSVTKSAFADRHPAQRRRPRGFRLAGQAGNGLWRPPHLLCHLCHLLLALQGLRTAVSRARQHHASGDMALARAASRSAAALRRSGGSAALLTNPGSRQPPPVASTATVVEPQLPSFDCLNVSSSATARVLSTEATERRRRRRCSSWRRRAPP